MSSRRRANDTAAALAFAVLLGAGIAACGTAPGPTPNVVPSHGTSPPGSASAPGSGAAASASGPASPAPAGGGDVVVDRSLLAFLPIGGNGLVQIVDEGTAAEVAKDPNLRANASALAIVVYQPVGQNGSPPPADDLAVVSVIRLRDPSVGEDWFRAWRDSYDEAACANAGGVTRRVQTDIAGRTVLIDSCAGGSLTYHTRLAAKGIVISITAIGPTRLGQRIMEHLVP